LKFLRQVFIVLAICLIGELINRLLKIPIPGNVIGMILLFLCLVSGIIKLEMIEDISKFLLDHLAFFFLPAGVGLISYLGVIKSNWIAIFSISCIISILVMIISGQTVQFLKRRLKK
jgi:holin-like protein